MNRIEARMGRLAATHQKGLIVYIGAGDPDLASTRALALAFDEVGVDVLELGIPFSDPLADGLVNQLAAQRGLESGTTPPGVLDAVRRIRQRSDIPIVLYVYYNLLHRRGLESFIKECAAAGVDGLLVLDLPPEESDGYDALMDEFHLCPIYLVAPTTPEHRVKLIVPHARGFIYYVSREGVTGMQKSLSDSIGPMTRVIRRHTALPIAVGFGISNAVQAKTVAAHADAIVVGSAVVDQIAAHGRSAELVPKVKGVVESLAAALKGL